MVKGTALCQYLLHAQRRRVCVAEGKRAVPHRVRLLSRGGWLIWSTTAPRSLSSLPGPVILDLPQSSMPRCNPQSPLLQEHSTAVGQVSCESVIHLVCRVLISLTNFLQQRACAFVAAGPIGHTSKLQYASLNSISLIFVSFIAEVGVLHLIQRQLDGAACHKII